MRRLTGACSGFLACINENSKQINEVDSERKLIVYVLDLRGVYGQRKIVHYRDVNKFLCFLDTIQYGVDIVGSTLR